MSEKKKTSTLKVPKLTQEEIAQLTSDDNRVRELSMLALLDKSLPELPKKHVFKMRERRDVELSLHAAFELRGGVPGLLLWSQANPGEFYKIWSKLIPEPNKAQQATQIIINSNVGKSELDKDQTITIESRSIKEDPDADEY